MRIETGPLTILENCDEIASRARLDWGHCKTFKPKTMATVLNDTGETISYQLNGKMIEIINGNRGEMGESTPESVNRKGDVWERTTGATSVSDLNDYTFVMNPSIGGKEELHLNASRDKRPQLGTNYKAK